jgi:hypothetical protein
VVRVGRLGSAGRRGDGLEFLKRREQLARPGPCALEMQLCLAAVEREAAGDVQQPVAQRLRFSGGELALKTERLGPDDQVVGEQHELDPHLVHRECFEWQFGQAGVFVIADAVLDPGALAVAPFDHRDVGVGLVGEDCLEAVAVQVAKGQLRAGVRSFAPHDHSRAGWPGAEIDMVGELDDLSVLTF